MSYLEKKRKERKRIKVTKEELELERIRRELGLKKEEWRKWEIWWDIAVLDIGRIKDALSKLEGAVKAKDVDSATSCMAFFLGQVHELTHIIPSR